MTDQPTAPAPDAPGPQDTPDPGGQQQPQPDPAAGPAPNPAPAGPGLESALKDERKARAALQKQLDQLRAEQMSDQEKAVAEARAEGRAEAEKAAALKLAAAEFRNAAAGRIADPAAALDLLDLTKLLKDGEPDTALITAAVERLAGPAPDPDGGPQQRPRVPAGPRQPAPSDGGDFIRGLVGRR